MEHRRSFSTPAWVIRFERGLPYNRRLLSGLGLVLTIVLVSDSAIPAIVRERA
jgi:hypothetical protein